jgi:hypothetical protein
MNGHAKELRRSFKTRRGTSSVIAILKYFLQANGGVLYCGVDEMDGNSRLTPPEPLIMILFKQVLQRSCAAASKRAGKPYPSSRH